MKKTEKIACAIACLLLSCATEPGAPIENGREVEGGVVEGGASALAPVASAPMLTGEEVEAQIAERMAALALTASSDAPAGVSLSSVRVRGLTDVQRADGFYVDCFSSLPRPRRACRRMFNRRASESALIEHMGSDRHLEDITRLVLGRIILSEANWIHDERRDRFFPDQNHAEVDAPAIYQVLRYTRRNGETLLGAMRRHAPHVSEARPIVGRLAHRRMSWITRLQLDCREPTGFPAVDSGGNPMNWERDYRPRCEALFAYAQRLLDGDAEALGPWAGAPGAPLITWGGRCEDAAGACDDHLASHRGLVPFDTGDTANRFWCRPGPGCNGPPLEIASVGE